MTRRKTIPKWLLEESKTPRSILDLYAYAVTVLYILYTSLHHLVSATALAAVRSCALVLPRVTDTVVVAARPSTLDRSPLGGKLSIVQRAVSTHRSIVLVDVVGVEHLARGESSLVGLDGGSLVGDVGSIGVSVAESGVEWTREELGTHPVRTTVDGLVRAVLGRVVDRDLDRSSDVGLVVTVGTGDDNVEVTTPSTHVGSCRSVNVGAPQSALVVGDGRGQRAPVTPRSVGSGVVLAWVERWVALDEDVERSAAGVVGADGRALRWVVGLESPETHVGRGRGRAVHVVKGPDPAIGGDSVQGSVLERSLGHPVINGVRVGDVGTESIRLGSARVLRVDETAVSAVLGSSSAGSIRRGGGRSTGRERRGGRAYSGGTGGSNGGGTTWETHAAISLNGSGSRGNSADGGSGRAGSGLDGNRN